MPCRQQPLGKLSKVKATTGAASFLLSMLVSSRVLQPGTVCSRVLYIIAAGLPP